MGTHFKGTKNEINALNVYLKLMRSAESVSSRINVLLFKNGLTNSQFYIMDALYHVGPLNQKVLGEKLLKSGGNITMVVDNLEKQNYVKRERGKDDRRLYTVHLTQTGKDLIEKIFPEYLNAVVEEFKVLNEDEQIEFQRMCKMIGIKNKTAK